MKVYPLLKSIVDFLFGDRSFFSGVPKTTKNVSGEMTFFCFSGGVARAMTCCIQCSQRKVNMLYPDSEMTGACTRAACAQRQTRLVAVGGNRYRLMSTNDAEPRLTAAPQPFCLHRPGGLFIDYIILGLHKIFNSQTACVWFKGYSFV